MNFMISFYYFPKAARILVRITLNLFTNLESAGILAMLIIPAVNMGYWTNCLTSPFSYALFSNGNNNSSLLS